MDQPTITAFLKTHCGWSRGVRAIFEKYHLDYKEKNIQEDPRNYQEMVELSGQPLSPCVVVNGIMLADVSGDEVEEYLLSEKIVTPTDREASAPTDQACETHGEPLGLV